MPRQTQLQSFALVVTLAMAACAKVDAADTNPTDGGADVPYVKGCPATATSCPSGCAPVSASRASGACREAAAVVACVPDDAIMLGMPTCLVRRSDGALHWFPGLVNDLIGEGWRRCTDREAAALHGGLPMCGPSSTCSGATAAPYVCGGEARACDPNRPVGLPSGACEAGATCDVTVRPASCNCPEDPGPRFPWSCSCVDGTWSCIPQPPDGRVCGCSFAGDAGADAGGTCAAIGTWDIADEASAETICKMTSPCRVCVQTVDETRTPIQWAAVQMADSCPCPSTTMKCPPGKVVLSATGPWDAARSCWPARSEPFECVDGVDGGAAETCFVQRSTARYYLASSTHIPSGSDFRYCDEHERKAHNGPTCD